MIKLETSQVYQLLDLLNTDYEKNNLSRHFQLIRCLNPQHIDKHVSNAFIDIYTGVWHCKACKASEHILKTVKKQTHLKFKDIMKFLGIEQTYGKSDLYFNRHDNLKKEKEIHSKVPFEKEYLSEPFNPDDYEYTRKRGYTNRYCKQMDIEVVSDYFYKDYLKIPINFSKEDTCFEFRKLKRKEYLDTLLPEESDKEIAFEEKCLEFNIKYRQGKLFSMEMPFEDENILYLLKPKVLYSKNSNIKTKLYNFKDLKFDEDLIIFEGTASHPKVFQFINKNCTSTFGANVSDEQLDLLSNFKKRIILISDSDNASYSLIGKLNEELSNIFVFDTEADDTDFDFVDKIKKADILPAFQFLRKRI